MKNLYIKTYGCQMNVYDSSMIADVVTPLGFKEVKNPESADMIILNTCHIREKATEKVYSELGRINLMEKEQKRKIITVVAGCVAQAEGEEIFERAKNVDVVIGPQSIHTLPELLIKVQRKNGEEINLEFPEISKFDSLIDKNIERSANISSFLSVQEGCDKFCTYCVVPYTRGVEYSRSVSDIYREALSLVKNGAKEITLLGQNVNAYHGECDNEIWSLGKLMQHLTNVSGLERIRYTTSHPNDMHEELYLAHEARGKIMPYLHLPVQSGSDKILKRMNRKHNSFLYYEVISKVRESCPDIALSSDFIVGFPGETDEDFEQTLELVEEVKYSQAYSFKYSPRPGTPSAEYKNQVPDEIKNKRLQILQKLLRKQQLEYNQGFVGKTISVLFDRKNDKQAIGRSPYMQAVYVDDISLYGEIKNILITEGNQNSLKGILNEN
ncbi:MAG: tRNA (N6-isopentenyl adenosine(37)-C2)-methylthiotransferase MiaB [Rickettsiaceae bacterium H1]|nr:tRNA (N6-isopentenyl adenosine(37)-C2)-methylthiotransferase MiaB [Rickettsiaceae bacterium H1]